MLRSLSLGSRSLGDTSSVDAAMTETRGRIYLKELAARCLRRRRSFLSLHPGSLEYWPVITSEAATSTSMIAGDKQCNSSEALYE